MFVHENGRVCLYHMHVAATFLAFSLIVELLHATPQRRNLAVESLKLPPSITDVIGDPMGISPSLMGGRQFIIANDINPLTSHMRIKQTLAYPATAGKPSTVAFVPPSNAENRPGTSKKKVTQKTQQTETVINERAVFPSPSPSSGVNIRNSFSNRIPPIPNKNEIDKCRTNAIGGTLCNNTDNYPTVLVRNLINSRNLTSEFFGTDKLQSDDINTRFVDEGWKTFCESREQVVFPKIGETADNEWKFIFQDPSDKRYRQGVRTEICMNEKAPCNIVDVIPNGYEIQCSQKYIYRTMISIGTNSEVQPDVFKLPSCCVCVYKPQPESRMAAGTTPRPGPQTSTPKKGQNSLRT